MRKLLLFAGAALAQSCLVPLCLAGPSMHCVIPPHAVVFVTLAGS